jgi:hypothetical protein
MANPDARPNIHIALDIDQTLAGGVVSSHMRLYNERLELGMAADEIDALDGQFGKTFDVPQIQKYRDVNEEGFQQVRSEIRTSKQVHLDFKTLPGSIKGALALVQTASVSYYSVRPIEVEVATKEWLKKHGFPNPEEVVICDSHEDKLRKIAADHLAKEPEKTVLLIDDSFKQLADAAGKITDEEPEMKVQFSRLVLVGFGVDHHGIQLEEIFYLKSGIRTIALPSWESEHLKRLTNEIQ